MRAVKSLVAFMGVLIIIGIGVLGYGLYKKSTELTGGNASTRSTPSAPDSPGAPGQIAPGQIGMGQIGMGQIGPGGMGNGGGPSFDILSLGEPKGTVAREFRISGSTLVVELAGGGKPPRLVAVDLSRGKVLGTILLNDAP
ncbi:MAG: hypothetical protein K9H25_03935 [Rhodospirillum sp.]|nr:hypothetical protein [Rhodospirillum sp.]MCF8488822.1 hypothetical protein [Rhodospirillum sp.]MCF8500904.1 hypothetical protein [Rhodospirillum sp.]